MKEIRNFRYNHGWSFEEISAHFGCTRERIRQLLGGAKGINTTRKKHKQKRLIKAYLNKRPELLNIQLAEVIGCSVKIVASYRGLLGFKPQGYYKYRFWRKADKQGENDCWEWQGARLSGNAKCRYGSMSVGKASEGKIYAHRLSWEIHNGEIPNLKSVLHKCDNTICVNPNHLYLGTAVDNMRDRDTRGRNGVALLSLSDITEMKRLYKTHKIAFSELGTLFGVSGSVAANAVNNRTYQYHQT